MGGEGEGMEGSMLGGNQVRLRGEIEGLVKDRKLEDKHKLEQPCS